LFDHFDFPLQNHYNLTGTNLRTHAVWPGLGKKKPSFEGLVYRADASVRRGVASGSAQVQGERGRNEFVAQLSSAKRFTSAGSSGSSACHAGGQSAVCSNPIFHSLAAAAPETKTLVLRLAHLDGDLRGASSKRERCCACLRSTCWPSTSPSALRVVNGGGVPPRMKRRGEEKESGRHYLANGIAELLVEVSAAEDSGSLASHRLFFCEVVSLTCPPQQGRRVIEKQRGEMGCFDVPRRTVCELLPAWSSTPTPSTEAYGHAAAIDGVKDHAEQDDGVEITVARSCPSPLLLMWLASTPSRTTRTW
jgi:hypothetical protein